MTYKIESILKLGEITGNYGTLHKYAVKFEGQENSAEMLLKPESVVPKVGESLDGMITNDPKWGLKFKRESSGGFSGQKNDPAIQQAIIRQNALTNSVNYCVAKSNLMSKEKAIEYLTGKEVINVAMYFSRWSEGKINFEKEEPKEIAPLPRQQVTDEVDLNEIDFGGDDDAQTN